jgi:hypothetical protein
MSSNTRFECDLVKRCALHEATQAERQRATPEARVIVRSRLERI